MPCFKVRLRLNIALHSPDIPENVTEAFLGNQLTVHEQQPVNVKVYFCLRKLLYEKFEEFVRTIILRGAACGHSHSAL